MAVMSQRSALPVFFVLALGATFALQLPGGLAAKGLIPFSAEQLAPLVMLGVFMPMAAAMWATRREGGRARDVWKGLLPRVPLLPWGVAALLTPGAIYIAAVLAFRRGGGAPEAAELLYLPTDAQRIAGLLIVPLVEEVAWRGYALPRLTAAQGPVKAAAILGVLWAVWHVPMFMFAGADAQAFLLGLVFFVAGSFVFTWFAQRTGGALFIALMLHVGAHLNNSNAVLPASARRPPSAFAGVAQGADVNVCSSRRTAWIRPPSPKAGSMAPVRVRVIAIFASHEVGAGAGSSVSPSSSGSFSAPGANVSEVAAPFAVCDAD
jgi:membrane protease YdiL (CAAX protease family)